MTQAAKPISIPRWYQDLSIRQMQKVFELGDIMRADDVERIITERMQRALGDIGVTSTFVKITRKQIRELRRSTDHDPVKFLSEVYRIVAGRYFTDEEYKKVYDCNERIILSAIAFLTLPATVIELHSRIPMGQAPKLAPKPVLEKITPPRSRIREASPYLEPLFARRADQQQAYKEQLYRWRQRCRAIPKPRAILPPWIKHPAKVELSTIATAARPGDESYLEPAHRYLAKPEQEGNPHLTHRDITTTNPPRHHETSDDKHDEKIHYSAQPDHIEHPVNYSKPHHPERLSFQDKKQANRKIPQNQHDNNPIRIIDKPRVITAEKEANRKISRNNRRDNNPRRIIDEPPVTAEKHSTAPSGTPGEEILRAPQDISRLPARSSETIKPAMDDYEIRPNSDKKSWLGEKEARLMVTGVSENAADYQKYRETSGFAYVTPDNSDENFFALLNLPADGDKKKREYPRGRENLSRNWQEWLHAADEEFMILEKCADEIIKSIQDTAKLVPIPEIYSCDACCSCRQTRRANIKYHKTKTPRAVIESVATDGKKIKYIVGSLSMNSPAPSPSNSTADIPEAIASHDEIIKNNIVSGITNESGETRHLICGVSKEIQRVPRKMPDNSRILREPPMKNVPPCDCAIEKMMHEGFDQYNIPSSRDKTLFRQEALDDKRCGRNPLKNNEIDENIRANLRAEKKNDEDDSENKKMYSLAAFRPCGNEEGMAICGGPWGAVNVPDAQELARREALAKLILESPPCGEKPGRAVCGAPFGTRHPVVKKRKKNNDDDDDDDDEELEPEDELEAEDERRERRKREREARMEARKKNRQIEPLILSNDETCSSTVVAKMGEKGSKVDRRLSRSMSRMGKRKKSLSGENESRNDESHRSLTKQVKNEWNRLKKMANKLIVSPIVVPGKVPARKCTREDDTRVCLEESSAVPIPFGRRTRSEEALPPEVTLIHLVDPEIPVKEIPVRPGGKACDCRENRNKIKTLLYNVTAMVPEAKGKRDTRHSRVIDGLIYITPTASVRNSEEYLDEYELYDSPYEICAQERKSHRFKYVEKYLGPKSLMAKNNPQVTTLPCDCDLSKREIDSMSEEIGKTPPREKCREKTKQITDNDLVNFYSRCRDNVPCRLRCVEFSTDGCCAVPRKLRIVKPVCECKYERKIVRRDEEKIDWLRRQAKLKTMKKEACNRVAGLSRPMGIETNFVIANVTRNHRDDVDDIDYCVTGIAQDNVMLQAERIFEGVGMITPAITPKISQVETLDISKPHPRGRHSAPMNLENNRRRPANEPIFNDPRELSSIYGQTAQPSHIDADKISEQIDRRNESRHAALGNIAKERPNNLSPMDKQTRTDSEYPPNFRVSKHAGIGSKDRAETRVDVLFQTSRGKNVTHHHSETKKPRYDVNRDEELKQSRPKGNSKNVGKLSAVIRRKSQTGRSLNAGTRKKSPPTVEEWQKSRDVANLQSDLKWSAGESVRKHGNKSTGSLLSKQGANKVDLQDNRQGSSSKINLSSLMQIELEKMSNEGYLFARLPACHQMPQLQYWIMYRKGVAFTLEEKKKLMDQSVKLWSAMEKQGSKSKKIEAPAIEMSKKSLENLTFDKAEVIRRDVAAKRATFYSHLRKLRVLQARTMWNTMEFGKFPGVSFKQAYFAYQAGKEADGFVFKPWEKN